MSRHQIGCRSVLDQRGLTITATCALCGQRHIKHLSTEALDRIALKNETRTATGIENHFDGVPCVGADPQHKEE